MTHSSQPWQLLYISLSDILSVSRLHDVLRLSSGVTFYRVLNIFTKDSRLSICVQPDVIPHYVSCLAATPNITSGKMAERRCL